MAYELDFTFLSAVGNSFSPTVVTNPGNGLPAYAFNANQDFLSGFDAQLTFVGSTISVGGGPFNPINQLPVGFTLDVGTHSFGNRDGIDSGFLSEYTQQFGAPASQNISWTVQFNAGPSTTTINGNGGSGGVALGQYSFTSTIVSDLFSALVQRITSNGGFKGYIARNIKLTGPSIIVSNNWALTNVTHPSLYPSTFLRGDQGKLTATSGLSTVTKITINGRDITTPFDSQTDTIITFTIPSNTPTGTNVPATITNPTIFTGSALLAVLNVVSADPSGVYNLTPGKLTDTIYQSSSTGNSTIDVARPNPFFKTGYLGG